MITFNIGGILYKNITSSSFTESMIDFTNEASFDIVLNGAEDSPFLIGESCLVYLDDVLVMTGIIFDVNLSYSSTNHKLKYIVRDITADFADSDINEIDELITPISLEKIIETVLKNINPDNKIKVINEVSDLKDFGKDNDKIDPEYADNAFDYIQGLAKKRQVLLSTNASGNIVIYRNNNEKMEGKIRNLIDDKNQNNILDCSFSKKQSDLFNVYVVRTQLGSASSASSIGTGASNAEMTDQKGEFTDQNIRTGRQKCIVQEEASAKGDAITRARWLHDFSEVESSNYAITVQGHSIENNIFKSNKLIKIDDDFARIHEFLLIRSVTCTFNNNGGSVTALDLVNKNSFKVLSETQQKESERTETKTILGSKI